jgi:signal transduction histidine kinase
LAAVSLTAQKLAHEIANPLNGMYMTAQLLERLLGLDEDHPATPALKRLSAEIRRLDNLLQEFSELARRERYAFYPLEIPSFVRGVLEQERPLCEERGIEVAAEFSDDIPKILADREKLTQALLNLFKNAREAMSGGGKLTVRGYRSDGNAVLEVEDSGEGIPPGVDVFQPFFTTKKGGTGLGLMIVRQIVTAHGGRIACFSERGKGALFRLCLPARPEGVKLQG